VNNSPLTFSAAVRFAPVDRSDPQLAAVLSPIVHYGDVQGPRPQPNAAA